MLLLRLSILESLLRMTVAIKTIAAKIKTRGSGMRNTSRKNGIRSLGITMKLFGFPECLRL